MNKAKKLLMKRKGVTGFIAFVACLWMVVVATYAAQIRVAPGSGKSTNAIMLTNTSCNSNSSSGGTGNIKPPGQGGRVIR